MKKILVVPFLMLLSVPLVSCGEKGELVILYTNDVHCNVSEHIGYDGLSSYKKKLEAQGKNVILVDCGDHIQGQAIGFLSNGEIPLQIINSVGYDVAIPGNHEFDYTAKTYLELAKTANYPYISSNFYKLKNNERVFDNYKIIKKGNYTIGFIGITTPDAMTTASPSKFYDETSKVAYTFLEGDSSDALVNNVQATVNEVKSKGVDYVVALAHLGEQSVLFSSTEIISKTNGIDLLLDGHSHTVIAAKDVYNKDDKLVPVSQSGTELKNIGKATFKNGTITTELISDYTEKDAATTQVINEQKAKIQPIVSKKVGHTNYLLTINDADGNRMVRKNATNLSDLCSDAFMEIAGAQAGFINGAGVRKDIKVGDILFGDVFNVSPYGNMLACINATGEMIKNYLEFGATSCPNENPAIVLPSKGFTYTIDSSAPAGSRCKNIKLNGVDLDMDTKYKIAGTEYNLISGPDAPTFFPDCEILPCPALADSSAIAKYIEENLEGEIPSSYSDIYGERRITILA